jgi:HEAT repeat protein
LLSKIVRRVHEAFSQICLTYYTQTTTFNSFITVQRISLQDSLAQAHLAARRGDWLWLLQWLQHELSANELTALLDQASPHPDNDEVETLMHTVLNFAFDILQHGDFQERWDVAKLIPQFGDRAIAPLLALLQSTTVDLDVRWFAVRMVGEFHQPEVLSALIELLPSAEDELQDAAMTALAGFGEAAIAPLSELLDSPTARPLAIRTLAQIHHAAIIPLLLHHIHDDAPSIRAMVLETLSSFHDVHMPSVFIAALRDPSSAVRQVAVTALGLRHERLQELDVVALMAPLLADISLEVCQQTAIALSRLRTDAAAHALFEALQAPYTPTPLKVDLVRSLGWIETPTALTYLQQVLQQAIAAPEMMPVVQEIILGLGHIESPQLQEQATQLLLTVLHLDQAPVHQPSLRQALALSLGHLGHPVALDPLIQLLADADAGVKLHAVAALKRLDSSLARLRLETLARDNSLSTDLSHGVAIALQEW